MERILVLGSSGSGKSIFAQQLGEKLEIEVIHLDSYYWKPNWTATPDQEWEEKISRLLEKDLWVMDGNYPSSLPLRMKYADTIIFLDFGSLKCLWRCVRRYFKYKGMNRPELASGCNEKIDKDFLKWIWYYPRDIKPKIVDMVRNAKDKTIIELKGSKQVKAFLYKQNTSEWITEA